MSDDKKMQILEKKITLLQYELEVIKSIVSCNHPKWSDEALKKAIGNGLKPSPYGESIDMIRLVDLLNKLGVLK